MVVHRKVDSLGVMKLVSLRQHEGVPTVLALCPVCRHTSPSSHRCCRYHRRCYRRRRRRYCFPPELGGGRVQKKVIVIVIVVVVVVTVVVVVVVVIRGGVSSTSSSPESSFLLGCSDCCRGLPSCLTGTRSAKTSTPSSPRVTLSDFCRKTPRVVVDDASFCEHRSYLNQIIVSQPQQS